MKQTINFSQFCDSFSDTYKNNFSYEGKRALFDYLESLEEDTGNQIELDPIALCCEYAEYESLGDIQKEYSNIVDQIESLDDLRDRTQAIECSNGHIIIQQF